MIDFPSNPTIGQIYSYNGYSWQWNGSYWKSYTLSLNYLSLSGGTVTGPTNFTSGLTANTISATTYQNLPVSGLTAGQNINISGTSGNFTISFTGTTGSSFTGGTVSGATNFINGLSANTISATTYQNLPTDVIVTGATYSNNTFTYTNNTGGTFNVLFNTVTGLTVNGNLTVTGDTSLQGLTATTISATTYQNLPTDVRVTGATYSNNTFTYTNNTGGTFNVLFNTVTGLTVNGNLTVTGNTSVQGLSANTISATTISGETFLGNGSGLTNVQNIYNTDGILSSDRYVNISANTLWFSGLTKGFQVKISDSGTKPGFLFLSNSLEGPSFSLYETGDVLIDGPTEFVNTAQFDSTISIINLSPDITSPYLLGLNNSSQVTYFDSNLLINSISGATYSNNTFTYRNNTGGTFNVLFNTVTGLTVNGNLLVNSTITPNTEAIKSISQNTTTSTAFYGLAGQGTNAYGIYCDVTPSDGAYSITNGIGGYFEVGGQLGNGTPSNSYSLQLKDGTEGVGKVLTSITSDGKANWSNNLNVSAVTATTISASTYLNLTKTGQTTVDFGFTGGGESDYATTVVSNTNILQSSMVMYSVIASNDHQQTEDSLLDGLTFKTSDIIDGVSFTVNCYSLNNTWGSYNVFYKIIN